MRMIKSTVMEHLSGLTGENILETGRRASSTGEEIS